MFDATIDTIEPDRAMRYSLSRDGYALSYSDVLSLWQSDPSFRDYFTELLASSPFAGFRWETPAVNRVKLTLPFQFVLLNSPGFAKRATDQISFQNYFTADDTDFGVVAFENLSGDATLIVPSPRTDISVYGHLAAFVRGAPKNQVDAVWKVIGRTVASSIDDKPLWLSTAGGGVAWLHVRLDSHPKYYGYQPYRIA